MDPEPSRSQERVPYSRYGYRPPGARPAAAAAGPPPSAPPQPDDKPETPLDAPPPYETIAPRGPPSYEAVCRELASELTEAGPGADSK